MSPSGIDTRERPNETPETGDAGRVRLRIAFLTSCIAPYFLPVMQDLTGLVDRLRVFVSTPMEKDRPWKADWEGLDVTLQRSFETRHSRVRYAGFTEDFVRHFPVDTLPLLLRYKPDVVVSAQLGLRTIQAISYRLLRRSSRLVIWADLSAHTESEIGGTKELIRRLLLRCSDAVVVSGQSGLKYVTGLGVPENRVVVAPYVTEMSAFLNAPLAKDAAAAKRLLFVGRLVEGKGMALFLPALIRWCEANAGQRIEMWLVGDGPLRKQLESSPRPSNLSLRFFGDVPYSEMPGFYRNAGILVFPTLFDTWGLVVNEALGAGLPVLGSVYSQAVEELVTDGWNGWTFRPDREDELQKATERALSCPSPKLAEMARNSRTSVVRLTPRYSATCFLRAIQTARNLADATEGTGYE